MDMKITFALTFFVSVMCTMPRSFAVQWHDEEEYSLWMDENIS